MNKQRKMMAVAIVVLALAVSGGYAHFSSAKKSEQTQANQHNQQNDNNIADIIEPTDVKAEKKVMALAAETKSPPALYPIATVNKIAENDHFELYIDDKTANIRMVSKETGTQWLGSPQLSRRALPSEKKFTESPVHIKYTEGVDVTSLYSLKDKETKFKVKKNKDGAVISFNFAKQKLTFDVVYRIREDGMEVTVPFNSIKESGAARIVSLEVLPFMNAALEKDQGAIFMPDGSGALMEFKTKHPAFLKGYSESIYGPDTTFTLQNNDTILDSYWKHVKQPKEKIALPVFGLYRNNIGILGIVTKGEFDAKINATPAGIRNISYYRASTEFVYRKDDEIFIGGSNRIPFFQGKKVSGDRQVRFVMLEGKEANYVGMAQTYRNYLLKEAGVKQIDPASGAKLNLRVMGGIKREEIIGSTFVSMTSFDQTKAIIDAYAAEGIKNLEITLEGWSDDGLKGNQPDHFPIKNNLGGSSKLKELAKYAEEKGIPLYLSANYSRAFSKSNGFSKKKDAVRGINREALPSWNYYAANGWNNSREKYYFLKPDRMFDRHIGKELDDFAKLGVSGVSLQYMGNALYSDQDTHHFFDRSQTAAVWVKSLDAFREKIGKTAVDYGFGYTLGHVDRLDGVPMDSSHFVYNDRTVPFYQIVVHGLIPYTDHPVNLRDDARVEFLRQLEYGATPSFKLTYENTSKLQRTGGQDLYSSTYKDWIAASKEEYQTISSLYDRIATQPIMNHEQLGPKVFRTTYGNGTSISVNYGTQPVTVEGQMIQGLNFLVKEGN
jgi:hypothetical protein